ncbi:unnamed protein product [Lactuca virosa]|uniref:Uncharacterized protein n=1 Tax=Lactuca virosa TaxID=75947 RepID=A0AAU9M284_9ASTR|nr:unnamed protein product [Lactuca virosa]
MDLYILHHTTPFTFAPSPPLLLTDHIHRLRTTNNATSLLQPHFFNTNMLLHSPPLSFVLCLSRRRIGLPDCYPLINDHLIRIHQDKRHPTISSPKFQRRQDMISCPKPLSLSGLPSRTQNITVNLKIEGYKKVGGDCRKKFHTEEEQRSMETERESVDAEIPQIDF